MEEYTNKYMLVFNTYDDFAQHSADYLKGEDHIAYLIQENEVIYWLYLEQVWRPLNVRTTTTGELEDGRTKVAVRLEYIEGGQKYTSVPNIPDPERITSMSRFLEDYPDIEEVNVSGTVNLTDLSYAFADSKIKDFSMLDTSNVTNWSGFINNITNETLELNLNCDVEEFESFHQPDLANVTIKSIIFTCKNLVNTDDNIQNLTIYSRSNIEYVKGVNIPIDLFECTVNTVDSDTNCKVGYYARRQKLTNINTINCDNTIINIGRTSDVTHNGENLILNIVAKQDEFDFNIDTKHKIITNAKNINFEKGEYVGNFLFGYGVKYNEDANIIINTDVPIGNFYFTVPIVNDAFYAKYAQYNTPISIFQYKTTFEEVADVKISSEVDSGLLYVDWSSINFDTNNMNIEINNKVDIYSAQRTFNKTFNKFIINSGDIVLDSNYKNKLPLISALFEPQGNEVSISGTYLIYNGGNNSGHELYNKINNATLVYDSFFYFSLSQNNLVEENNIKFVRYNSNNDYGLIYLTGHDNINIDNYVVDNVLYCTFHSTPSSSSSRLIYNENYNIVIKDYCYLNVYEYYLQHENKVSLDSINDTVEFRHTNNLETDTIYLNCIKGYLQLGINQNNRMDINTNVENINGNINLELPLYHSSYEISTNINLLHIDINSVRIHANTERQILIFNSCDKETTINLITKLKDNTGSTTNIIYMYRSQANIIGDDNIAAAVAKNYEFAIIEN